jgi:hypothetical protein
MKVLLALACLFALVAAQCNLHGNTYADSDGNSITFGHEVGSWVPALFNMGPGNTVNFATFTQDTETRWTVTDFGSTSDFHCELSGTYVLAWMNGCKGIQLQVLHDGCGDRSALLFDNEFTLVVTENPGCLSTGGELTTVLGDTTNFPILAGDSAHIVFGNDQYAITSVASRAVIIQRWRAVEVENANGFEVVDLGSYPAGFSCSSVHVGTYIAELDDTCAGRLCGANDGCQMRGELWHNAGLNGFTAELCPHDFEFIPNDAQCSDGRQWRKHPNDCLAQQVEGGCMYCKGIAMGEITAYCLNQEGARCQTIFESATASAFCNLEFECPASVTSISFILIVSSLLALLFL